VLIPVGALIAALVEPCALVVETLTVALVGRTNLARSGRPRHYAATLSF
jgi:hypothetical protein